MKDVKAIWKCSIYPVSVGNIVAKTESGVLGETDSPQRDKGDCTLL